MQMRFTQWNASDKMYECPLFEDSNFIFRTEQGCYPLYTTIIPHQQHFISGNMIDKLAEYENTELTPKEIHKMKETIEKLKESNDILRKNNDEYFKEYEKLLFENQRLRELVRVYLK